MSPDSVYQFPPAGSEDHASLERVRRLEADVASLRAELERKDAALAKLAERLVDVEAAREDGAKRERDIRIEAEVALARLEGTKIYRYALRPRDALYRRRQRLS